MRLPQSFPMGLGAGRNPSGLLPTSEAGGGLPNGNDSAAQGLPSVCRLQTMGLTPKEARTPQRPPGPWRAAGRASQVSSLPPSPSSLEAQTAPGGPDRLSSAADSPRGLAVVQSLRRVRLFAVPWTVPRQVPLSFNTSRSLLRLMSIQSVMPSNHLILCHPLLLLPSIFLSIGVFSKELAL